jgi:hypothetical protein
MNPSLIVDRPIAELAKQIRELCGDDEQAFVDTLDGETDTIEMARRVVRFLKEAEANETMVKGLADTYAARAKVFADRQIRIRGALLNFMQEIGSKSLPLPEATLSVGAGQPSSVGEPDVATLPLHLTVAKRQPDKVAIRAALEAGEELPGLSLSNAVPRLSIRMK